MLILVPQKDYFDTPEKFRIPKAMKNTLLKMAENFRFAEIWLRVPRKVKSLQNALLKVVGRDHTFLEWI